MTTHLFHIPIRTVTGINAREHHMTRARRAKKERAAARMICHAGVTLPVIVTLTRVAPRSCDKDNNQGALKHIRDGVADKLGIDDADPRVTWRYEQRKAKEFGVDVRIEPAIGMYTPRVAVGDYTICRRDETSVWIAHKSGEGGQFSDELFGAAIAKFYAEHF
jgi:hypothetical protein